MFGSYEMEHHELTPAEKGNSLLRAIAILIGGGILIGLSAWYFSGPFWN